MLYNFHKSEFRNNKNLDMTLELLHYQNTVPIILPKTSEI